MAKSIFNRAYMIARNEGIFELISRGNSELTQKSSERVIDIFGNILDGSENNVEKYYYSDEEYIKLGNLQDIDHPEAISRYQNESFVIPRGFYIEVQNAAIVGSQSTPWNLLPIHNGQIIAQCKIEQSWQSDYVRDFYNPTRGYKLLKMLYRDYLETSSNKVVCPLIGKGEHTYMHWILEYLPRIQAVEHYEQQTGTKPKILVSGDAADWRVKSINLIGIDQSRIQRWVGDISTIDKLLLPSRRHTIKRLLPDLDHPDYKVPSKSSLDWLRKNLCPKSEDSSYPNKIYVSRNKVGDSKDFHTERQVGNENQLVEYLGNQGFQRIFPENYSISEQANLFYNADKVVTPHGSALTNIIFGRDLEVIEIFGQKVTPAGFVLTSILGLDYQYMKCPEDNGFINVDIDQLSSML